MGEAHGTVHGLEGGKEARKVRMNATTYNSNGLSFMRIKERLRRLTGRAGSRRISKRGVMRPPSLGRCARSVGLGPLRKPPTHPNAKDSNIGGPVIPYPNDIPPYAHEGNFHPGCPANERVSPPRPVKLLSLVIGKERQAHKTGYLLAKERRECKKEKEEVNKKRTFDVRVIGLLLNLLGVCRASTLR